jgi:hypothetical protein
MHEYMPPPNLILIRFITLIILEEYNKWSCSLHNKEHYDLYSSPNIIRVIKSRRMGWAGNITRTGERRGAYRILVEKPDGTRLLGRPRHR